MPQSRVGVVKPRSIIKAGPEEGLAQKVIDFLTSQAPDPADALNPIAAMASPLKPAVGTMADVARDGIERLTNQLFRSPKGSRPQMDFVRRLLEQPKSPSATATGRSPRTPGQMVGQTTGSDQLLNKLGADNPNTGLDPLIQALADEFARFRGVIK